MIYNPTPLRYAITLDVRHWEKMEDFLHIKHILLLQFH